MVVKREAKGMVEVPFLTLGKDFKRQYLFTGTIIHSVVEKKIWGGGR